MLLAIGPATCLLNACNDFNILVPLSFINHEVECRPQRDQPLQRECAAMLGTLPSFCLSYNLTLAQFTHTTTTANQSLLCALLWHLGCTHFAKPSSHSSNTAMCQHTHGMQTKKLCNLMPFTLLCCNFPFTPSHHCLLLFSSLLPFSIHEQPSTQVFPAPRSATCPSSKRRAKVNGVAPWAVIHQRSSNLRAHVFLSCILISLSARFLP